MSIGLFSDFKIYQEEFKGGMVEAEAQNLNLFNANAAGAIKLVSQKTKGEYEKEAFYKGISGAVTRRDLTSTSTATPLKLSQGEFVRVKVSRKFGPVEQVLEGFKMQGADPEREFSFILGKLYREAQLKDQVNTAVKALVAALGGQSSNVYDYSGTGTIAHGVLATGLAKMGDRAEYVRALVMHSKTYWDLVKQAITDKVVEVAGVTIMKGNVATFNRPTIVIDDPSLLVAGTPDVYNILGLVEGAGVVNAQPDETFVAQIKTGAEQLTLVSQGEYGFTLGIKGFAWDVTNGGANPTDAAIATATNWDKAVTSSKDLAGILVKVQ